jgi:N-acetylmuramoyl-L-alanine amidase
LGSSALAAAKPVDVRAVRLWAGPDSTRVVLDLSGNANHSLSVSHQPERVVVDVSGAHLAKGVRPVQAGAGLIRQLRMAGAKGQLHIVIDTSRATVAKSFLSKPNKRYGYRLVLDLSNPAVEDKPSRILHAPSGTRDLIVAIDAGHGGDDPGAIGKNGTREKDVVLAIARELAAEINSEPGMRAVLTRGGDYFVPLRDRMRRARSQQADLFVSVHADSIADRSIDGSSVYILSQHGATNEAARWLAERENASDLIGGVSLDDKSDVLASVLLDLSQTAAMNASESAAQRVLKQLRQAGEIRKTQVQQAGFMVLKSPDIPSMLVETAYISNPYEESKLRTSSHQAEIAGAIRRGVHDYFYANPPQGSRVAQLANGPAREVGGGGGGN